ncbi:uncharacterized protein LOC127874308 isoform X1 [Dreissena polymorpha]|uniref:Transmembrane protein n=1 Tax=Dreissena polymorpha TaxID=45954 RepID=A0A9D4LBP6_DREPO|nr:uncharacterized protein LOC127874308 isoform X1 [Dreissena polymorpha]KAH3854839.1 hypothetical protein DPMN_097397 [Dreissena polymorpha]
MNRRQHNCAYVVDTATWAAVLSVICALGLTTAQEGTKCYRNEAVGEKEGNVYYCADQTKTECCEEDAAFTCCEPKSKKTLREQLILWGIVIAVGVIIALVCCYFWRDNVCSKSDKSTRGCCRCCRRTSDDDRKQLTPVPQPGTSKPVRSFSPSPWRAGDRMSRNNFSDSPVPPFQFRSPTYGKY